jgi:hypothetical protein
MPLRLARSSAALLLIGLAGLPGPAAAGPAPKAVVELFTSQGCSSCPPADQFLTELAGRPDVLALTLPVDYWDYLGWKDSLAQPAFTARQRAYASARNDKHVYTPQIVFNGLKPVVGSDRAKIESLLGKAVNNGGLPVAVAVSESGASVTVEIGAAPHSLSAEAWLLPVARAREVAIGRGENKGRTITYANVVRGMVKLGDWSGAAARFEVPLDQARSAEADTYVVLLQAAGDAKPGAILGAAKGPGL